MASNILSIGQSALSAAQVGISTTGHNIANASTPGYSRQTVTQAAAQAQNFGYGFVGQGTTVASVTRTFNELLHRQMVNSQSTSMGIETYSRELSTIENMLSDEKAGLNPTLNAFFASVKSVSANASDIPTRETLISNAQSMVNRFNTMGNRLNEIQSDVNTQISGSVSSINAYATQLSRLNDIIDKSISTSGSPPNDLMDQRDQLVAELSKQIKTTVIPQGAGSYNVFIGNGMPLVVGTSTFELTTKTSPTDSSRQEVAYNSNGNTTVLGKESLSGGILGGLVQFRSESLDKVQNQIGQIALVMAQTFNAQHKLGADLNGATGGDLFEIPAPTSQLRTEYDDNHTPGGAVLSTTVNDPNKVLNSDYKLVYDGTNYTVTRLSDGKTSSSATLPMTFDDPPTTPPAAPAATNIDGLDFTISGTTTMVAGDEYAIRPTKNIASTIKLLITDPNKIAMAGNPTSGKSDNSNGIALGNLQTSLSMKTSVGSTAITFSAAFAQMVSSIGSKSNELKITGESEAQVLTSATKALESESGVNLDEEAANLLRYQQAYQAAGKMMQIASELFNVLLQLGV